MVQQGRHTTDDDDDDDEGGLTVSTLANTLQSAEGSFVVVGGSDGEERHEGR